MAKHEDPKRRQRLGVGEQARLRSQRERLQQAVEQPAEVDRLFGFPIYQLKPEDIDLEHLVSNAQHVLDVAVCAKNVESRFAALAGLINRLSQTDSGYVTLPTIKQRQKILHTLGPLALRPEVYAQRAISTLSPEDCHAKKVEQYMAYIQRHLTDGTSNAVRLFVTCQFGIFIQDAMCQRALGKDYNDDFAVEEYYADSMAGLSDTAVGSVEWAGPIYRYKPLHDKSAELKGLLEPLLKTHPLFMNIAENMMQRLPLRQTRQFETALLDTDDAEAMRIGKKLAYHINFYSLFKLWSDIASREKSIPPNISKHRADRINKLIYFTYGRAGFDIIIQTAEIRKTTDNILHNLTTSAGMPSQTLDTQFDAMYKLQKKPNLIFLPPQLCSVDARGRIKERIVERIALDQLEPDQRLADLPELDPEQFETLETLTDGLAEDLALTTRGLADVTVHVTKDFDIIVKLGRFTSEAVTPTEITVLDEDQILTMQLNEHFAFDHMPKTLSSGQRQDMEIIRSLALAALHDQTHFPSMVIAQTRAAVETLVKQPDRTVTGLPTTPTPPEDAESSQRPRRVHRSHQYIVTSLEGPKSDIAVHEDSASHNLTVKVMIEGHWRELAGPLVRAARAQAWQKLDNEGALHILSPEQKNIVAGVLFKSEAAADMMGDDYYAGINQKEAVIINDLMRSKGRQSPILPDSFPKDRFVELTQLYYTERLNAYAHELEAYEQAVAQAKSNGEKTTHLERPQPDVKLPRLHKFLPHPEHPHDRSYDIDVGIGQRWATDQAKRPGGARLRPRETMTYVGDHETTFTLSAPTRFRRHKKYLIVRGTSAFQAVQNILLKK